MTSREVLAAAAVGLPALTALLVAFAPRQIAVALAYAGGLATAAAALALSIIALHGADSPFTGNWIVVDAAGGLLVGVVGIVGLASVLVSPAYLDGATSSLVAEKRRAGTYFAVLFGFWSILLAVPLAANLGGAWLLVEATTAASALLVGFSGKAHALEAAWKYLILTSLGTGGFLAVLIFFRRVAQALSAASVPLL